MVQKRVGSNVIGPLGRVTLLKLDRRTIAGVRGVLDLLGRRLPAAFIGRGTVGSQVFLA